MVEQDIKPKVECKFSVC